MFESDQRTPEEMQSIAEEAGMMHISTLLEDELAKLSEEEQAEAA